MTLTESVARAVPRLLDHVHALGDLAIRIPVLAFELVGARERIVPRIGLLDEAGLGARDVAGAGVKQRHLAQVARQGHQVLDAEGVDLQRLVERRVEVDHARHVHDRVARRAGLSRSSGSSRRTAEPRRPRRATLA
jgi:hypothetical protein